MNDSNRSIISILLISNCDEFLFYDDLVQEQTSQRKRRRTSPKKKASAKAAAAEESGEKKGETEGKEDGIDLVLETAEALIAERGDAVWGSMVKQTLRRRRPGFSETAFGFRSFNDLLEEAADRGLLSLQADQRSGGYLIRSVERE